MALHGYKTYDVPGWPFLKRKQVPHMLQDLFSFQYSV